MVQNNPIQNHHKIYLIHEIQIQILEQNQAETISLKDSYSAQLSLMIVSGLRWAYRGLLLPAHMLFPFFALLQVITPGHLSLKTRL